MLVVQLALAAEGHLMELVMAAVVGGVLDGISTH